MITLQQALRLLPVPQSTLYDLLAKQEIQSIRVASAGSRRGRILIVRRSLEDFVGRCRLRAAPPAPARVDVDGLIARFGGG